MCTNILVSLLRGVGLEYNKISLTLALFLSLSLSLSLFLFLFLSHSLCRVSHSSCFFLRRLHIKEYVRNFRRVCTCMLNRKPKHFCNFETQFSGTRSVREQLLNCVCWTVFIRFPGSEMDLAERTSRVRNCGI